MLCHSADPSGMYMVEEATEPATEGGPCPVGEVQLFQLGRSVKWSATYFWVTWGSSREQRAEPTIEIILKGHRARQFAFMSDASGPTSKSGKLQCSRASIFKRKVEFDIGEIILPAGFSLKSTAAQLKKCCFSRHVVPFLEIGNH